MNASSTKPEPVPLLDLKAQHATIRAEVLREIERVIDSQYFILGPEVDALEAEIAEYCQAPHALGVSSGTDALLLAFMGLGLGAGDSVITTPYTFFATAGSLARVGAGIQFVDIDPVTFNLDPELIESAIQPETRAIVPVHLYGRCADLDRISELATKHDLKVVEDAAQAIGSEWRGQRAGSIGDVGCFSFFPSKNLGGYGDGGIMTFRDPELYEHCKILRVHGGKPKYYHSFIGGNFRLDAIQAAGLRVKLRHLDAWSRARRENAEEYNRRFVDAGLAGEEIQLVDLPDDRHVINQYIIRCRNRDGLVEHLRENGVGCEIYYPVPLHLQECFEYLGYREGQFPHSELAAKETLALPVYPELTEGQKSRVVEVIREFYRG